MSRPGHTLPPGKTRYPLYRRLDGPLGRSGQVQKISPSPGFDPRTVQHVGSRYTDYATQPTHRFIAHNNTNNNSHSSWVLVQKGISQGSNLRPLFFLLFINDVPIMSKNATLVLYAEDTSITITSPSSTEFSTEVSTVFADINEWFKSNVLSLNLDKTHFLQF